MVPVFYNHMISVLIKKLNMPDYPKSIIPCFGQTLKVRKSFNAYKEGHRDREVLKLLRLCICIPGMINSKSRYSVI